MASGIVSAEDLTLVLTAESASIDLGIDLSPYAGKIFKLTITDTNDKSIVGYINAVVSGTVVTIVSEYKGDVQSWASQDEGFDAEDDNYTYLIEKRQIKYSGPFR